MPSALASFEIVIGTLLVIAVVVLAATFLRRRYIAHGLPLTLCGLRPTETDRWHLGLIRFGEHALEWYTLGGVSLRPKHRWQRQSLLLTAPRRLPRAEAIAVLPDAYRVVCTDRAKTFELALQGPAYTALRSWQEAAPPGYNVNVA
ncbi:hypothetical protein N865_06790 [Intrasporangium oryzae NRRL B-24470]|uniref:DUF2550 family protein n=1 Tax=Intrasporangium oryzae NRRL B-24470 TaxID=1386089 RepID=W9GAN4_9MICO|nr:DUF2550 domain-containing protein [Intrasporangium oryzae]EWT02292.1 hypothetical protein N865_06790 [Intrasporangium oryzae NRRL B-24470]